MRAIFHHHMAANSPGDEAYLAEQRSMRDSLIAQLKARGKRVVLVHADHLESCGRYVCEGDDGVNGYDPLPGTVTVEEEG